MLSHGRDAKEVSKFHRGFTVPVIATHRILLQAP